jgi:Family of unknown function (DUF5691)
VAAVLGTRGRWLAAYRADWQRVADAAPNPAPPSPKAPEPEPADEEAADSPYNPGVWDVGGRSERRAYLATLRDRDPAAATELLAAGWDRETGDDRADLISVLARGLSAADEEFLEAALDDRKEAVRAAARGMLARLPGSAFTRRAAERAAPLLRVERRGLRQRLVATLPERADAAAVRDGIRVRPPHAGIGDRAWLLIQMIAAAPLAEWAPRLGVDPRQLVSLPADGGLGADVFGGWRLAAIGQRNPEWAELLLGADELCAEGARPPAAWPPHHQLAAVLPRDAQLARTAALLAGRKPAASAVAEAARCPGPWPGILADAVVAALSTAVASATRTDRLATAAALRARHRSDAAARQLAYAAGRSLPVAGQTDYAAALVRLAGTDNCPGYWSAALRSAADAITLRRAFLEEIR